MVYKTLNLARQSIAKTLSQGYVQSIVAASQTSYASQTHPFGHFGNNVSTRFGKTGSVAHHSTLSGGQPSHAAKSSHHDADSGLSAYYAAWQKYQKYDDNDWQQFQFAKLIEWKPSGASEVNEAAANVAPKPDELSHEKSTRPSLARSASENAVDLLINASVVQPSKIEIKDDTDVHTASENVQPTDLPTNDQSRDIDLSQTSPEKVEKALSSIRSNASPSFSTLSQATPATSVASLDVYTEHLINLAEAQDYEEIPKVFQAILVAGSQPSTAAYNTLLTAAINLPRSKHQVVPQALDVYTDMVRRGARPDATTYSILIELLAARSLDVSSLREAMEVRRMRYGGLEEPGQFIFKSNEVEHEILSDDNSLQHAVKLFKTAFASKAGPLLTEQTYRLLITACAEGGRIEDMVAIYSKMESRQIAPCTEIFSPMIGAFARAGDVRSVEECYAEYKAHAVANNAGEVSMSRKDEEVYAALIRAYSQNNQPSDASRFFDKARDSLTSEASLLYLHNIVGLKAFIPQWLSNGAYKEALDFASLHMTGAARRSAQAMVTIHAADRDAVDFAVAGFDALAESSDRSESAIAIAAMHFRNGYPDSATPYLVEAQRFGPKAEIVELATMQSMAAIGAGDYESGARQARSMFTWTRDRYSGSKQGKVEIADQIDEAIETIGQFMAKRGIVLSPAAAMQLLWAQIENGGFVPGVAVQLLSGMGPDDIAELPIEDMNALMQAQASIIMNTTNIDLANATRFGHMLKVITSTGIPTHNATAAAVEKVLIKIDRPDMSQRWQMYRYPPVMEAAYPPASFQPEYASMSPASPIASANADSFDPYAAATDNKGSVAINELLDKTHGKAAQHLNDALTRFRNMRRAGRHPRFYTYAKMITAAAKEGRMNVAHDILNMARQDVPLQPQYRIVRFGWTTILDSMVAACLNSGRRDLAAQFHQEMRDMGSAPSANTFGLYITTLKESTKTFDEASEAVKIFAQAKAEGVQPSSFLYNALIGKLGKARRIDDCLFYFGEMRSQDIRPTSVTYGTIVNALCRVSDETFAEELFDEMESMPNYKPRPAPYHSMMQFFLTTKRDRSKVLAYYERMKTKHIRPTPHTFKLLIDTHASLEPLDMPAAEAVLEQIRSSGALPEAIHYSSLIHARGCVQHDLDGARALFDTVLADARIRPQPCLYQALFEGMVANHRIAETEPILRDMHARGVEMTPYIANSLIHGWTLALDAAKARAIYESVPLARREPSTYEAMTRAHLADKDYTGAKNVVNEALSRGYPAAVAHKILDLLGGSASASASA